MSSRSSLPAAGLAVLALAGIVTLSCGGPVDPSKNVTEQISGVVNPSSSDNHSFSINRLGEFSITVTSITPGGVSFGVGLGQPSGSSCALGPYTTVITAVGVGRSAVTGQIQIQGTYCVLMFDPGPLQNGTPFSVAQSYQATFSHP
jgi:hypothetical protein